MPVTTALGRKTQETEFKVIPDYTRVSGHPALHETLSQKGEGEGGEKNWVLMSSKTVVLNLSIL